MSPEVAPLFAPVSPGKLTSKFKGAGSVRSSRNSSDGLKKPSLFRNRERRRTAALRLFSATRLLLFPLERVDCTVPCSEWFFIRLDQRAPHSIGDWGLPWPI